MKGIKMVKSGTENTETFEMLTRTIDGEVCLDVECGPNKAVLYLSKLIGGSKNECILHDMEWLTPNAFQKRSGRGSAKDWKRSIRHNGVSLKTFMLCGILEMPVDSRLKLKIGKEAGKDSKLQGLKGNQKKAAKRKVDLRKDFDKSTDEEDIAQLREVNDGGDQEADKTCEPDKEQETNKQNEARSLDNKQNENPDKMSDNEEEKETGLKTQKKSTDKQCDSTFKSAIDSKRDPEIRVSEKLSVDPYEMTVTPPPTPPNQVYEEAFDGSKLEDKSEQVSVNQERMSIKYKPYLLQPDEMNTKGDNPSISKANPYPVTSPRPETTKQSNISPNTDENPRHSVIVTYPVSSSINSRIPTDRRVFTYSTIRQHDHFQRSYKTPETDSKRYDDNSSRVPRFDNNSEFLQRLQYNAIEDRVIMNEQRQYSGYKRQYDELEQQEPLDLSMKKKKVQNQGEPSDWSRGHHERSHFRIKDKTSVPPPIDVEHHLNHLPIPKLTNNHLHSLLHPKHPLQMLKYDQCVDRISPYVYGFYVNPLQK